MTCLQRGLRHVWPLQSKPARKGFAALQQALFAAGLKQVCSREVGLRPRAPNPALGRGLGCQGEGKPDVATPAPPAARACFQPITP